MRLEAAPCQPFRCEVIVKNSIDYTALVVARTPHDIRSTLRLIKISNGLKVNIKCMYSLTAIGPESIVSHAYHVQEEITTSEHGSVGFQANTYDKVKYVGLKDTFTITPLVC